MRGVSRRLKIGGLHFLFDIFFLKKNADEGGRQMFCRHPGQSVGFLLGRSKDAPCPNECELAELRIHVSFQRREGRTLLFLHCADQL